MAVWSATNSAKCGRGGDIGGPINCQESIGVGGGSVAVPNGNSIFDNFGHLCHFGGHFWHFLVKFDLFRDKSASGNSLHEKHFWPHSGGSYRISVPHPSAQRLVPRALPQPLENLNSQPEFDFPALPEIVSPTCSKAVRPPPLSPREQMSTCRDRMSITELVMRFHTKDHFVESCRQQDKFTPPISAFSWDFIRQVMAGEKKLLDLSRASDVRVPPR